MKNNQTKINILDPNLSSINFYNYKFYDSIKDYKNLKIFGNTRIEAKIEKLFEVEKIFDFELNPRVNNNYIQHYAYTKKKFLNCLKKIKLEKGPILLYNSTLTYIDGLIEWAIEKKIKNKIYIEYPTILHKPINSKLKFEKKRCIQIKKKIIKNNNINFISHFEYSSSQIINLFGKKPKICSIPLDIKNYKIEKKIEKNNKLITIGFVGEQRVMKGLNIVKKIIFNIPTYNKIKIHNPTNNIEINKLNIKNFKNIKIIKTKFNLKGWLNFLSKIDIIIFPYNMNRYKFGYSATLIDSILLKKICIVPANTILSSLLLRKNSKITNFNSWNEYSILNTINNCIKKFSLLKFETEKQKKNFLKIQNKYPTILKLINNENKKIL